MARIARAQRRSLISSLALEVASVAVAVLSFSHIYSSFVASGTYSYLSLLISDGFGTLGYSRELMLSIAESASPLALAGGLGALLFLGWSTLRVISINSRSLRIA
jgi:hypothetical protein